jgi:hypothetical protein
LAKSRVTQLDALGFVWDPRQASWESMFGKLKQFHEENGHCKIPQRWDVDSRIASWVTMQRARKRSGTLSSEQETKLNSLGFVWDRPRSPARGGDASPAREAFWNRMYAELERYRRKYGNCNVSKTSKQYRQLGNWVINQRARRGALTSTRKARLDVLGFIWEVRREAVWESRFAELTHYKQRFGDCNIPIRWKENPQLATWVHKQRERQRKGKLSAERKARLDSLGFEWKLRQIRRDLIGGPCA